MSSKTVQHIEFTCDGSCGAAETVKMNSAARGELPLAWSAVTTSKGEETKHFCDECSQLMRLPLWNQDRQLRILNVLTPTEIEDFDLGDLHQKLHDLWHQGGESQFEHTAQKLTDDMIDTPSEVRRLEDALRYIQANCEDAETVRDLTSRALRGKSVP